MRVLGRGGAPVERRSQPRQPCDEHGRSYRALPRILLLRPSDVLAAAEGSLPPELGPRSMEDRTLRSVPSSPLVVCRQTACMTAFIRRGALPELVPECRPCLDVLYIQRRCDGRSACRINMSTGLRDRVCTRRDS
mmetsp:Transcript_34176/g.67598  ORF Transcript_34176/g.67598 Transcript_34176/m.67598 type:complete len:135 (+) Transcript_34176:617-1021(+)